MSWFRRRKQEDKEQREWEKAHFNTVTMTVMEGRLSMDDKGRVECKRCGVVYNPRQSDVGLYTGTPRPWGVPSTPFRSDECLIGPVKPLDYCPLCETHLLAVREKLLKVLKGKDDATEE